MRRLLATLSLLLLSTTASAAEQYAYNYSNPNYNSASRVSKIVDFIALQLSQNKDLEDLEKSAMAITSFVNLEDFKETNKFGNIIAENLVHDLYVRGFNVIDFKVMPQIEINQKGDYIFSRKPGELAVGNVDIKYLVSGTWSYYSDGITLNVRIIDVISHAIVSSAKAFVNKEDVQDILNSSVNDYKANRQKDQVVSKIIKEKQKKHKEASPDAQIMEQSEVKDDDIKPPKDDNQGLVL
jgi:TolB-like protein